MAEQCEKGIWDDGWMTGRREMEAEVARLREWISDLQGGLYVNCVYCGHRYGPDETTPVSMADALKAHVEQCPEHPMSALKADRDRLRVELRTAHELLQRATALIDPEEHQALSEAIYAKLAPCDESGECPKLEAKP